MDCEELPGRLRAICDGTALKANGLPFTIEERSRILSRRLKEPQRELIQRHTPVVSTGIGDRILESIHRETGRGLRCGKCMAQVRSLNRMHSSEARLKKPEIISTILSSLQRRKGTPAEMKAKVEQWFDDACGPEVVVPVHVPTDGKPMQFLWFYIPGPENGFELRHSIRSVIQNFVGEAKITVIGERPNWYKGHFIECARTYRNKRKDRDPFLDTQRKITVASTHPEINDEFVWIMDDTFLLQPTTIEELKVPRYDPWFKNRSNREWHRLISHTFDALKRHGKTNLQYGTHLPHHIEKQKLADLFQLYQYGPKNLLLWEILYGNHYRVDPVPYGGR